MGQEPQINIKRTNFAKLLNNRAKTVNKNLELKKPTETRAKIVKNV